MLTHLTASKSVSVLTHLTESRSGTELSHLMLDLSVCVDSPD